MKNLVTKLITMFSFLTVFTTGICALANSDITGEYVLESGGSIKISKTEKSNYDIKIIRIFGSGNSMSTLDGKATIGGENTLDSQNNIYLTATSNNPEDCKSAIIRIDVNQSKAKVVDAGDSNECVNLIGFEATKK